jgi:hypothetical protein
MKVVTLYYLHATHKLSNDKRIAQWYVINFLSYSGTQWQILILRIYIYIIFCQNSENKPLNEACQCLDLNINLIYVLEHDIKISQIQKDQPRGLVVRASDY